MKVKPGYIFKEGPRTSPQGYFVQEEEEQGAVQGGQGKERHSVLQQLRRSRAPGQGEEGDHAPFACGAHARTGTEAGGRVYCCPHNHQILLCELRGPLWNS